MIAYCCNSVHQTRRHEGYGRTHRWGFAEQIHHIQVSQIGQEVFVLNCYLDIQLVEVILDWEKGSTILLWDRQVISVL
jgi:hypothetical protein